LFLFIGIIYAQEGKLTLLTEAQRDGAVCLDGSPAAFYFRPGFSTGVNKWLLFHEGGGWCNSLEDCLGRSKTDLGSSKGYGPTMNIGGGYFSTNETENPLMYNWNMVYLKYCDGGSFSGNNETVSVVSGTNIYFRGFRNLRAYHAELATNHGLMSGTDFMIGGCSAGGLATYLHVDWWRDQLPPSSTVRGLPDSGFFLDYDSSQAGGPHYSSAMKWVFQAMNSSSGVNQDCIKAHAPTMDTNLCIFAEHTSLFIKTPIFPLQSEYDSWQVPYILGTTNAADINTYGQMFITRFKKDVLTDDNNGCFLDSCFHHCGSWDSISIDNSVSGPAVKAWYEGKKGVFVQNKDYPCTECCKP